MYPHSGALLHVLRNREYGVHHHPSQAPFHPEGLSEARLPAHITQTGGGCWLAYKKHAPWTPLVSPLTLPQTCPRATTCAVELTLLDASKVTIISCYLPQTTKAHVVTCEALSQLIRTLPHSLILIWGVCKGVGQIIPKGRSHRCPTIQEMGRAYVPHLHSAPTAAPCVMY